MSVLQAEIKDSGMRVYFGQNEIGRLIVRYFPDDFFGVVGARNLTGLHASVKSERRKALRAVRAMLNAFNLLEGNEEILSISTGTDQAGAGVIVVTTLKREIPHAQP